MAIRILVLLLFASVLHAEVKVVDGRITADLKAEPLTQVLDQLKTQTKMKLFVDDGVSGKTVSANFQDLTVAMALKKILEGTGINYAVMSGGEGEPQSVFIGSSAALGSAPKRLDGRPVGNRGVVQPVPPPPPPPIPQPEGRPPEQPQNKPLTPGTVNIPTGGGFVPNQPKPEQPPEAEQQQENQQQLDNNNNNDEE